MQTALAGTALLMGLAGGPHCVAMCGAACAGTVRLARLVRASVPVSGGVATLPQPVVATGAATVALHAGRMLGYAAGGALAAATVQGLGFASAHVAALRPLWVLLHVFVFGWGAVLAVMGRQPLWAHDVGRRVGDWLRPLAGSLRGVFAAGVLWLAMPCGLLYSALMLASLGNGPWQGAVVMAAFAAGTSMSLVAAPWLWQRLRWRLDATRQAWGTRIAGALLAAVALQAVWMDAWRQVALWCA
jgi:sulfite exporter TauE/SafE